ncbi:MAG: response regulator, partial [Planctomycetes bacterium]|nr:response regulator [Planctomycetota bacterium]
MKILLAEDEVSIAITLGDALEEAGHEIFLARDTDEALAILEREEPKLVITDVRMPGAGGEAVLKRSLELDSQRPVIVMAGFATVDKAVEAMRLGAVDYLQKPFR